MIILGIESTCDETSVGIVEDGKKVLANVVASSSLMHEKYGGIVPEVAAREQVKVIVPTLEEALVESRVENRDIDAIAIAYGPGLIGSLLIGVETAKALALAWDKPLIGVNHLVGHLYANWLEGGPVSSFPPVSARSKLKTDRDQKNNVELRAVGSLSRTATPYPRFPAIGLVVSGGHTDLLLMKSQKDFKWLGGTLDDAAGEVFDKVARVLGLPYPGGPEIELAARQIRNPKSEIRNIKFPIPMSASKDFNFSFSGLKTSVANFVSNNEKVDVPAVAYAFQEAVIKSLVKKTFAAVSRYRVKFVVVGGGVAANGKLRQAMGAAGENSRTKIFFPEKKYSVDNGAMIATAAFYHRNYIDIAEMEADPSLYFV